MIHIYHPNKAVKGFACSFWYSNRNDSLFATLVKQAGWDEKTQNGTFKGSLNDPTKKVNIKLSEVEACAILDCIERNRPFSTFHQSDESPKSISFTPWMNTPIADDEGNRPPVTQKGFSFSIVVGNKQDTNKNSFYIGLTFAEARYIREFLIHYLQQSFKTTSVPREEVPDPTLPTKEYPAVNNVEAPASNSLVDF